jgi:hypothetical protein
MSVWAEEHLNLLAPSMEAAADARKVAKPILLREHFDRRLSRSTRVLSDFRFKTIPLLAVHAHRSTA